MKKLLIAVITMISLNSNAGFYAGFSRSIQPINTTTNDIANTDMFVGHLEKDYGMQLSLTGDNHIVSDIYKDFNVSDGLLELEMRTGFTTGNYRASDYSTEIYKNNSFPLRSYKQGFYVMPIINILMDEYEINTSITHSSINIGLTFNF